MYPTITTNPENGNLIFTVECSITDPIAECLWNTLKIEKQKQLDISTQHKPVEDFTVDKFPVTVIETTPIKPEEKIIIPTVAPVMTAVVNEDKTHLTLDQTKTPRRRRSRKEMTELRAIKDNQTVNAEITPIVTPEPIIFTPIEPVSTAPTENVIDPPAEENKIITEPIVVPQETINQIADISTVMNDDSNPKPPYAQEALNIMIKGLKVDAVKFVKAQSGMDLASAKTYCDELWTEYQMEKAE